MRIYVENPHEVIDYPFLVLLFNSDYIFADVEGVSSDIDWQNAQLFINRYPNYVIIPPNDYFPLRNCKWYPDLNAILDYDEWMEMETDDPYTTHTEKLRESMDNLSGAIVNYQRAQSADIKALRERLDRMETDQN